MKDRDKINKTIILRGRNILKIAALFSLILILFNFAFFDIVYASSKESRATEITDIEVSDNTIVIKANGPLNYSIYKASDPFTIILDLEGLGLGKFVQKIFSKSRGITEIRPSQITSPIPLARLEILLSEPSDIVPQMKDGALMLAVKAEEKPMQQTMTASTKAASKIVSVKFEKTTDSLEMSIKGDGTMPDPIVDETESSISVLIPKVKMSASLPQKIPSPIKDIKYSEENDGTRFDVHYNRKIDSLAFAFANEIIIDIPYKASPPKKQETAPTAKKGEVTAFVSSTSSPTPQPQSAKPDNSELISLDFQDADVTGVLRLLADVSGKNIIIHPEVKGKISMKLVNVHWEQALQVILKSHNLIKVTYDDVIMVVPIESYKKDNEQIAALKEIQKKSEPQYTRTFTVNYVNVEKLQESIQKSGLITKDVGSISVDPRTRTLTIRDRQVVLDEVEKIIQSIDRPTKQVLIEARIVELNNKYSRGLGIEWGLKARPFNWETAIVGSVAPSVPGGLGAPGLINLPAATGTISDPTSAITFGYLNRQQTLGLDIRLSAIENIGKGKIISKPRIITADNQKAKIVQGESIPYGERDKEGQISTKFKDVAVTIEVTPQITEDNNILLDVVVNKEDLIEFVNIGGVPPTLAPRTTKLEGKTNLLLSNGETMVIGGIYKKDERNNEERVPFVASIPLVGELFKKTIKEDDIKEFIIFLTPKIVQR